MAHPGEVAVPLLVCGFQPAECLVLVAKRGVNLCEAPGAPRAIRPAARCLAPQQKERQHSTAAPKRPIAKVTSLRETRWSR